VGVTLGDGPHEAPVEVLELTEDAHAGSVEGVIRPLDGGAVPGVIATGPENVSGHGSRNIKWRLPHAAASLEISTRMLLRRKRGVTTSSPCTWNLPSTLFLLMDIKSILGVTTLKQLFSMLDSTTAL